ncbi:TPA: hypothetical protein ACWQS7_004170 [Escherichia coli]
MNDKQIEKEIAAKGKAARVTPEHIASIIASEHYFTAADGARFAHVQRSETYSVKIPDQPDELELLTFCVWRWKSVNAEIRHCIVTSGLVSQ